MSVPNPDAANNNSTYSKIMTLLRDSVWQSLGFLAAIISIILTVIIFFQQQPNKKLTITLESGTPLVDVNPEAASNIEIRYNNQVVKNASIMRVRINNSGNQPISEKDYYRAISFSFGGSEVVDYSIINSIPANIGAELKKVDTSKVEMSPVLLNQGDTIIVRFIIVSQANTSIADDFLVEGRIEGIREIERIITPITTTSEAKLYPLGIPNQPLTIETLVTLIFKIALYVAMFWLVLNIMLIGVKIAGAGDDADKRKEVLQSAINAVIGLVIALLSLGIVNIMIGIANHAYSI
jgi:hypothetical protein